MSTINKISTWGDSHHMAWFDFFRLLLGSFLFYKGLQFGADPHDITALIYGTGLSLMSLFIIHYVTMVHLMGGVMIALGFQTRWAVAFQIPIVLGAIILNMVPGNGMVLYSQLILSIVVFAMLIVFLIYGSGPISVDHFFMRSEDETGNSNKNIKNTGEQNQWSHSQNQF
jgi:putative oxidoreductase